MLAPGECSAWLIRSAATNAGTADRVGDHDDLARAGDAVDVDGAENVLLGQGDEEVARPDDLVDRLQPDRAQAVGQGRDPLGAADPIDLGHAQRVAGGQDVGVEAAERGGRDHHGDLGHARRLRGHDRHQQARRIRRRPARDADAHPPHRPVQQAQLDAGPALAASRRDAGSPPDRPGCCRGRARSSRDRPDRPGDGRRSSSSGETRTWPGSSVDAVDPARVVEHGLEPARGHVGADPLDDLPRRERLAERRDRARLPLRADDVPLGTQLGAQRGDRPLGVVAGTVNSPDLQCQRLQPVLSETSMPVLLRDHLPIPRANKSLQWRNPKRRNSYSCGQAALCRQNRVDKLVGTGMTHRK